MYPLCIWDKTTKIKYLVIFFIFNLFILFNLALFTVRFVVNLQG